MAKVYGYSDDVVVVEHIDGGCTEIDCYNEDVRIRFQDGTQIRVGYPKQHCAVWWIEVEELGTADYDLNITDDEDADIYSDVFEIEAEVKSIGTIAPKHPSGY